MCSGPGADTALFRHLMAVLGMPAGAAAVPWGSRSEHTARGLQAAPSGESRQAGAVAWRWLLRGKHWTLSQHAVHGFVMGSPVLC